MKNLAMATSMSGKIIEGYEKLNLFLKICKNILGKDMPKICYDISKINFSNSSIENPTPDDKKIKRLKYELFTIAMKKAIDDNIYDAASVFIEYEEEVRKAIEVVEYDNDGYPSRLRLVGVGGTVPQIIHMIEKDDEGKDLINNRFSNLKKINDYLTLKEVGQLFYIFGKLVLKKLPEIDFNNFPPCDNM